MTTAAIANKRTIFDRFARYTGTGQALDGVQVEYSYPGNPTTTLVYGGRITFEQPADDEMPGGSDAALALDVATIWVWVRVASQPTVRDAEAEAERIGDILGSILRKDPQMCGPQTWVRIAGGTSDAQQNDEAPIVHLGYRITATAYV